MMNKLFYLFFLCLFLGSCGVNNMTLSVKEPAKVVLPSSIKRAAIVDRTTTNKGNKAMDKMDEILSIEWGMLDSIGASTCAIGLYDELVRLKRFEATKVLGNRLINPSLGVMPSRLDWLEVEQLCKENEVDILFVLERYDTDTKIDYQVVPITIKTPLGIDLPGVEHHATVTTVIETAWRIYDPVTKIVYDEFPGTRRFISTGKGINPAIAIQAITNRLDLVRQNSTEIGRIYAGRVMNYWHRVSREYYVGGSSKFQTAKRKAQTGNWDGAAVLWLEETDNDKPRLAGRACYNMAIDREINDDLDKAIEWAQKSYEDYNNKLALDYVKILRNRKAKRNLLNQ